MLWRRKTFFGWYSCNDNILCERNQKKRFDMFELLSIWRKCTRLIIRHYKLTFNFLFDNVTCNAFEVTLVRRMYFKRQLYYFLINIYVNSSSRSLSKYLQKPIYFLICVKKDIAYDRNFLCVVSVVISPEWVHHSTSAQEQILCCHVDGVRI